MKKLFLLVSLATLAVPASPQALTKEERERGMSELPELPIAYADSPAFISADGREPDLYPLEEDYGADESDALEPDQAPQSRRRLASAPRAAK